MSETQTENVEGPAIPTEEITIRLAMKVTAKVATADYEGAARLDLRGALADAVEGAVRDDMMYGPDSLEPTDLVQDVISVESEPIPSFMTNRPLDTEGMSDHAEMCAARMAMFFDGYKQLARTEEDDNALADFLGDLMHFAHAAGLDWGHALVRAASYRAAE